MEQSDLEMRSKCKRFRVGVAISAEAKGGKTMHLEKGTRKMESRALSQELRWSIDSTKSDV